MEFKKPEIIKTKFKSTQKSEDRKENKVTLLPVRYIRFIGIKQIMLKYRKINDQKLNGCAHVV